MLAWEIPSYAEEESLRVRTLCSLSLSLSLSFFFPLYFNKYNFFFFFFWRLDIFQYLQERAGKGNEDE
ncbi:MAG: hypothetical protein N7Q72_07125, partial [Spiroplasma sp. Tabriz.8]|nr:hypothetical protein [Spiroplasma sp. Tabriz.8]